MTTNNDDENIMKSDTHLKGSTKSKDSEVDIESLVRDIEFDENDSEPVENSSDDILDEFDDIFGDAIPEEAPIQETSDSSTEEKINDNDLSADESGMTRENARDQLNNLDIDLTDMDYKSSESPINNIVGFIKSNLMNVVGGGAILIFAFLIITKDIGGKSTNNLASNDNFSQGFDVDWEDEEPEIQEMIQPPEESEESLRLKAERADFAAQQAEFSKQQAEFKRTQDARTQEYNINNQTQTQTETQTETQTRVQSPPQITNEDLTIIKPRTVTAAMPETYENLGPQIPSISNNLNNSTSRIKQANTVEDITNINPQEEPLTVNINQPRRQEIQQNSLVLQSLIDKIERQDKAQKEQRIADNEFKQKLRKGFDNIQINFETIKNDINAQDKKISTLSASIQAISKKVEDNKETLTKKPKTISAKKVGISRPSYRVLSKKASLGKAWVVSNRSGEIVTLFEGNILIGWGEIKRITDSRIITKNGTVTEK
jgi:hypothetical protein